MVPQVPVTVSHAGLPSYDSKMAWEVGTNTLRDSFVSRSNSYRGRGTTKAPILGLSLWGNALDHSTDQLAGLRRAGQRTEGLANATWSLYFALNQGADVRRQTSFYRGLKQSSLA